MDLPGQRENHALAPALQDQGIEMGTNTMAMTAEEKHSLVPIGGQREAEKEVGPLGSWRQQLMPLAALDPHSSGESPSDSLQQATNSAIGEGQGKKWHEMQKKIKRQQEQHREDHRERKLKLRRRRMMREADKNQHREPNTVSPFNALPHFKYLEIAEPIEIGLPSELAEFGSMNLSREEAQEVAPDMFLDEPMSNPFAMHAPFEDMADMNDQEISQAAARMLQQIGEGPIEQAISSNMEDPESSHALKDGIEPSSIHPNWMVDNLICHYITCPVEEMHYEGPYYHNGELGDQNHPYFKGSNPPPHVWRGYEKMLQGISSDYEQELVHGFWAWHVPPFYYVPGDPRFSVLDD